MSLIGLSFPFEDQRATVISVDVSVQIASAEVRSSNGLTLTAPLDALWKAHKDYDCP